MDKGSKRSSMARSAVFLKAAIRTTFGTPPPVLDSVLREISSRIMEMKGAMPLPPLIITRESWLWKFRQKMEMNLGLFQECWDSLMLLWLTLGNVMTDVHKGLLLIVEDDAKARIAVCIALASSFRCC